MFEFIDQMLAGALEVDVDVYVYTIERMIADKGMDYVDDEIISPLIWSEDDTVLNEAKEKFDSYRRNI